MPLYSYACPTDSGYRKLALQPIAKRHSGPTCRICGEQMKLVIEAPAVVVKDPAVPRRHK